MGFFWCCCEDLCPLPETDLVVEWWRLQIPPIPGTRVDIATISLTFYPDHFGTGDHAWFSSCMLRPGSSTLYYRFALAKAGGSRAISTDDALAGGCCYWLMTGYDASPCDAANCSPSGFTFLRNGSVGSSGLTAFGVDFCAGAVLDWNFVSKTLVPFSETWNTGVQYVKIREP